MSTQRNQVMLNETVHRKLKKGSSEADVTMNEFVSQLLGIVNDRVQFEIGKWFDAGDKDFVVKFTSASALTIFVAINLREMGVITEEEFKVLLVSDSGRTVIHDLANIDGLEIKRAEVERYDVLNNTFVD